MEPTRAVHGGAFFDALGEDFSHLERVGQIVNADVLDAWYDPSPGVIAAIEQNLAWLIKTSPPTHGEGLRRVISDVRAVPMDRLVVGAGSSSLMFSAFPRLISQGEAAVILDPMYGEYAHLLGHMIGAEVRRFALPETDFRVDVDKLAAFAEGARLIVMVNPNSPTGVAVPRSEMERLLAALPPSTRVWVDETYIDFVPGSQSVEPLCADFDNLLVSKSMSKYYALSGLRVGYLCANPALASELAEQNPPWAVGMLAQIAAIEALHDPAYYESRTVESHHLRTEFATDLATTIGVEPIPSTTNYLLFRLGKPNAEEVVQVCREQGVFLRNCDSLSPRFQGRYIRTAVKSRDENKKIVTALKATLR